MANRLESGVIQEGDDWPGLFLRGDTAFGYAVSLDTLLRLLAKGQPPDPISLKVVEGLRDTLFSPDTRKKPTIQYVKRVPHDPA